MRGNQKELRIVAAPLNCPLPRRIRSIKKGVDMAKGQQRANKEAKKPKKDTSPPKPVGTGGIEPVRTITTAVIPRGKLKNK
jgi:hypothetical protein